MPGGRGTGWVVVLVAVLAVAGLTGARTADRPALTAGSVEVAPPRVEDLRVAGQDAVLVEPGRPNGAVVLFVHGVGQDARSVLDDPENGPMTDALVAAGYTVAASDAGGDAWGTPASVADHEALWREVQRRTGATGLFLLAESMGGLPALQVAADLPVRGIAALYPVCDLASVYAVPGLGAQIDAAWGIGTPAALQDLSPVAVPAGVPLLLWASPDDEVVPAEDNAAVCAAEARAGGADAEVVETVGPHGDPSNFDPPRLLEFLDALR